MQFKDEFLLSASNFLKNPTKKVLLISHDADTDIGNELKIKLKINNDNALLLFHLDLSQQGNVKQVLVNLPLNQPLVLIVSGFNKHNQLENVYCKYNLEQWQAKIIICINERLLELLPDPGLYFAPLKGARVQRHLLSRLDLLLPVSSTPANIANKSQEPPISDLRQHFLNQRVLINDPVIMRTHADRVVNNHQFMELMFKLLYASCDDILIVIGALNAITILNYANVIFRGLDFRRVRIGGVYRLIDFINKKEIWGYDFDGSLSAKKDELEQHDYEIKFYGADLSGGNFDGVNFSHADLRFVNFTQANLRLAKFKRSFLQDINFDEKIVFMNSSQCMCCCYSGDGSMVGIGDDSGFAIVCKPPTLKRIFYEQPASLKDLKDNQTAHNVCFSRNSELLATGHWNAEIHIWQFGKYLRCLKGHKKAINTMQFFPNEINKLASASKDATIRIWNAMIGVCLQVLSEHTNSVQSLSINNDGHLLISVDSGGVFSLWDDKGRVQNKFHGQKEQPQDVKFSPRNNLVASAGFNRAITLWDILTGHPIKKMTGHASPIMSLSFSGDGALLASAGGLDRTIRIWDVETGGCLKILTGHFGMVKCVAFHPILYCLISASYDGTVRQWTVDVSNRRTARSRLTIWDDYLIRINNICLSPSGKTLVFCSGHYIFLRDLLTGQLRGVLIGRKNINSICFTSDGLNIVSGDDEEVINIWDISTGVSIRVLKGHTGSVSSVSVDNNGNRLVSGSYDNTIRIWNFHTGECMKTISGKKYIQCVLFLPNNENRFFSAGNDHIISLWDVKTGQCLSQFTGHTDFIVSLAISANARFIAAGSFDCSARVFDLKSNACVRTFPSRRHGILDSGFERILASNLEELVHDQDREFVNTNMVRSIKFSHQGEFLAMADCVEVCIWDITSGLCVLRLGIGDGYTSAIKCIEWGTNNHLITGSVDGVIMVWIINYQEHRVVAQLSWCTKPSLTAKEAVCTSASGISDLNTLLLKQHGAKVSESDQAPSEQQKRVEQNMLRLTNARESIFSRKAQYRNAKNTPVAITPDKWLISLVCRKDILTNKHDFNLNRKTHYPIRIIIQGIDEEGSVVIKEIRKPIWDKFVRIISLSAWELQEKYSPETYMSKDLIVNKFQIDILVFDLFQQQSSGQGRIWGKYRTGFFDEKVQFQPAWYENYLQAIGTAVDTLSSWQEFACIFSQDLSKHWRELGLPDNTGGCVLL